MNWKLRWITLLAVGMTCWQPASVRAQESLEGLEEAAMRAAVANVAPAVIRIETLGGQEKIAYSRSSRHARRSPLSHLGMGVRRLFSNASHGSQRPSLPQYRPPRFSPARPDGGRELESHRGVAERSATE